MGNKYLNVDCKFRCNCAVGMVTFSVIEGRPSHVSINKKAVLTNEAILIPEFPGPATMCKKLPNPEGTPPYLPCILKAVKWKNCSQNTCAGSNLLTQKSKAVCILQGGELEVEGSLKVTCEQDIKETPSLLSWKYPCVTDNRNFQQISSSCLDRTKKEDR